MEPIKPERDTDRLYRYISLENGIGTLLIQDKSAHHSAAALNVQIGSFSDPDDLPGLAHYLEHMLFMGSAAYPEENAYEKFLADHGGDGNAFTMDENTCYHLQIDSPFFEQALDIFSNVFISPLMDPSTTERELTSVHNEDRKNEKRDSWRIRRVLQEVSNPRHPMHKFGTGNRKTLEIEPKKKNLDVRKCLLQFHEQYYSANLMKLVLAGNQSLDELESYAKKYFVKIKNNNIHIPSFESCGLPWLPDEHLAIELFIQTDKNIRTLSMTFPFPCQRSLYYKGSANYLAHLIGHEGEGSLLARLKKEGWASALAAGIGHHSSDLSQFDIDIRLSKDGFDNHIDDIILMTFQYIDMLRQDTPKQWIWNELKVIDQIEFNNLNKSDLSAFVVEMAESLIEYPPKDVLRGPFALDEFDPDHIVSLLALLVPTNMRVIVSGKEFKDITLDKKETYYGVPYHIKKLSKSIISKWNSPTASKSKNSNSKSKLYSYPKPNLFVPSDLTVLPFEDELLHQNGFHIDHPKLSFTRSGAEQYENIPEHILFPEPKLIMDSLKLKAFHLQDKAFPSAKLAAMIHFHSQLVYSLPYKYILTDVFCNMITEAINEYTFDALVAGYEVDLTPSFTGIVLQVTGYSQNLPSLLFKVLEAIQTIELDLKKFQLELDERTNKYMNFNKSQPYDQAEEWIKTLTCTPFWNIFEKQAACKLIDFEDLLAFRKEFFKQIKLEVLLHGNMTSPQAIQLVNELAKFVDKPAAYFADQFPIQRIVDLPAGQTVSYTRPGLDVNNPNSAVLIWYQVCQFTDTRKSTLLSLVARFLEERAMDELRTKQQLGYLIWTGYYNFSECNGFRLVIQSSEYPAAELERRLNSWMDNNALTELESISETEFKEQVDATIASKTELPSSLFTRTNLLWKQIEAGTYAWKRKAESIQILKSVTKQELVKFAKAHLFAKDSVKKVVVKITSSIEKSLLDSSQETEQHGIKEEFNTMIVRDPSDFKNSRPLLPLGIRVDWHSSKNDPMIASDDIANEKQSYHFDGSMNSDDEYEDEEGEEEDDGEDEEDGESEGAMDVDQ